MNSLISLNGILVIAEKNIRIYYNKAPVFIFGLLFPLFMFVAFFMGRELDIDIFLPGFVAMTLFFTASSVSPLITPWERQAKTYERLLTYPVTLETIILGDVVAGGLFGILITVIVMAALLLIIPGIALNIILLAVALIFGSFCFAALGSLLSSPATSNPSNIMMLSSIVRFPLIFISGIFIPLHALQGFAKTLAYFSPLTYLVDLINAGFGKPTVFNPAVDVIVLIAVAFVFLIFAKVYQRRIISK